MDLPTIADFKDKCDHLRRELAAAKDENERLLEDNALRAQSYDANVRGWTQDVAAARAERDEALATLRRISEWGCNGDCAEFHYIQCPSCLAREALEAIDLLKK